MAPQILKFQPFKNIFELLSRLTMGFILDLQFFGLEYEKGATSAISQKSSPINLMKDIEIEILDFLAGNDFYLVHRFPRKVIRY